MSIKISCRWDQTHLSSALNFSVLFVACCYLGEWPPTHIRAADVNVRPIHDPEWGMQSSAGKACHINKMNLCVWTNRDTQAQWGGGVENSDRKRQRFCGKLPTGLGLSGRHVGKAGRRPERQRLWRRKNHTFTYSDFFDLQWELWQTFGWMTLAGELLEGANEPRAVFFVTNQWPGFHLNVKPIFWNFAQKRKKPAN